MRRRDFVVGLGGLALVSSVSRAQPRSRLIGVLASEPWQPIQGLRDGLDRAGHSSRTLPIEYRWFQGQASRLPALAAELVALRCDAIVTIGTPAALAAKAATNSIPIVMGLIGDPVGAGLVSNIARPEANITGVAVLAAELEPKRLELLKEIVPSLIRVAVLGNADNPYSRLALSHAQRGAASLNLELEPVLIKATSEIEAAFHQSPGRPSAVLVVADQALLAQRTQIAAIANQSSVATAFTYREHVEAGGLLSYSTDYYEAFRLASTYVDKILKGAAPRDLPIQQVTKFQLIISQRAAKSIGLSIPATMLGIADEVIE